MGLGVNQHGITWLKFWTGYWSAILILNTKRQRERPWNKKNKKIINKFKNRIKRKKTFVNTIDYIRIVVIKCDKYRNNKREAQTI